MKKTITIMMLVMVMAIMSVVPVLACEEQSEYDHLTEDMHVVLLWSYEELDSDEGMYLPYYLFTDETMPDSIEELNEDIDVIREDGGMITIVENENGYYDLYIWNPETQPSPMDCGILEG